MTPLERKEQMLKKWKERSQGNENKEFKSLTDLNLEFSKETIEWYRNNFED